MKALFFVSEYCAESTALLLACDPVDTVEKEIHNPFSANPNVELLNRYSITAIPTVVIVDDEGNEVRRYERETLEPATVETELTDGAAFVPVEEGNQDEESIDGPGD